MIVLKTNLKKLPKSCTDCYKNYGFQWEVCHRYWRGPRFKDCPLREIPDRIDVAFIISMLDAVDPDKRNFHLCEIREVIKKYEVKK